MGYHKFKIPKGKLGLFSKIEEEYCELEDAISQENPVLILVELSDLIGAIESYSEKSYGITLDDLIRMKNCTKSAFEEGERK